MEGTVEALNATISDEWRLAKIANHDTVTRIDGDPGMPTRNVNLTADQDEFIEKIVRAGRYQNASEAMRDAIRGLQQRLDEDTLRLELLRTQIKAGVDALARGACIEVDDAHLEAALDDLAANGAD